MIETVLSILLMGAGAIAINIVIMCALFKWWSTYES
jgi:hypothetical protein